MTNLRREAWSPFLKCLLDLDTWLTWSRTGQGEGRGADREPHSCSLLAPGEGVWMAAPRLIAEATGSRLGGEGRGPFAAGLGLRLPEAPVSGWTTPATARFTTFTCKSRGRTGQSKPETAPYSNSWCLCVCYSIVNPVCYAVLCINHSLQWGDTER